MSGVDLNTIRELMRHKSLEMTQRYAHLSENHKSDAVDKLASQMDTVWTPEPNEAKQQKSDGSASQMEVIS